MNLARILDSAQVNNLAVMVGLPMSPTSSIDGFYKTPKADAHVKKITAIIEKYKNHPALLCWCLGNELEFPYKPNYNPFYKTYNDLVDIIHHNDPQHPVTTTIMSFQKKDIINIKLRTNIDFISFNIFGSIKRLGQDLQKFNWFWDGPFLITEWGVEGPWIADNQNAWGAYIESTSTKKAEQYMAIYQKFMPVNNSRFLGSMVFYWGQKQELTPTWFSLFDDKGAETQTVKVMEHLWTGKPISKNAPSLKYVLLDERSGRDNIMFKPNTTVGSKAYFESRDTAGLTYKWKIYKEDWFKPNGFFNEKKPKEISDLIIANGRADIQFKTPAKEGPYRLLLYVYDQNGGFATSSTPFMYWQTHEQ